MLKDNADASLQWCYNYCRVIVNVVAEVSKMAKDYQDIEKRVKKQKTQIKAKANEADLSEIKRKMKAELADLATSDCLGNLQQKVITTTKEIKSATQELEGKIPGENDIRKLLRGYWWHPRHRQGPPTEQAKSTQKRTAHQISETLAELSKEVMEQKSRRKNPHNSSPPWKAWDC